MRKTNLAGKCAAAFGGGLIVALLCPPQWLVAILALVLIGMGIFCFR